MAQASPEKLEHTGPAEKERVALAPQREQLATLPKGTKHQIVRGERVKVSESRILARKSGIGAGARRKKDGLHSKRRQIPRRKGRASKESLHRRRRRKHERVSGRKSSPGQSAESWFYSKSGQLEMGNEEPAHRMKE